MKNIQIGSALKTMRKNRGWTIHDVVVQLNDLYNIAVAEKTVYGWESDQAYPRTETLLLLCELYHRKSPAHSCRQILPDHCR